MSGGNKLRKPLGAFIAVIILVIAGLVFEHKIVHVLTDIPEPLDHVKTERKALALTINVDWGEEFLPGMLQALAAHEAKGTFFVTGRWAGKNPELVKQIVALGHEIGNHGYSHPHPDKLSVAENQDEIQKTENIILKITGAKTQYYAPPYGERGISGLKAANTLGYRSILWTLDTVDWRSDSTPEIITKRIVDPATRFGLKPVKQGAIVLMHPKKNTLVALPIILERLSKDGYRFVTISQLITLEGAGHTTTVK